MNNSPDVSVIVPAFNEEKHIGRCIECLLRQDCSIDYEIIIVDNDSNDSTPEIIKKYNVIYIPEKNKGRSYARNAGIKSAKADIIAFLDADCFPEPHWLQMLYNFLNDNDFDIAGGDYKSEESPDSLNIFGLLDLRKYSDIQSYYDNFGYIVTGNMILYKYVLDDIGCFNTALISFQDFEFMQRAANKGKRIGFCNRAGVFHRVRTSFSDFLKKDFRVGCGAAQAYLYCGIGEKLYFADFRRYLPPVSLLKKEIRKKYSFSFFKQLLFFTLYYLGYFFLIAGSLYGYFSYLTDAEKNA